MVFAEATARMVAVGKPPLVYQSIQLHGAEERNAPRHLTEAWRTGPRLYTANAIPLIVWRAGLPVEYAQGA
jgi:hypothetical protein